MIFCQNNEIIYWTWTLLLKFCLLQKYPSQVFGHLAAATAATNTITTSFHFLTSIKLPSSLPFFLERVVDLYVYKQMKYNKWEKKIWMSLVHTVYKEIKVKIRIRIIFKYRSKIVHFVYNEHWNKWWSKMFHYELQQYQSFYVYKGIWSNYYLK